MRKYGYLKLAVALVGTVACGVAASAQAVITSANGTTRIGINATGDLNGGSPYTGIAYNFTGQGGRTGFQDALTPGCDCEAWGVSGNGVGGQVGVANGNQNITAVSTASTAGSFTSVTALAGLPGLTISQTYAEATSTATGALFRNTVVITNTSGATVTDLRYARAMDWDVPPTEFSEFVTHRGTTTTSTLLRSTDNGFANANPLTAVSDGGITAGTINTDFEDLGAADHGSLFVFGFGELADNASYTFNIFYGAGADETDALALLGAVSPELYSLGQSSDGGSAANTQPTFVFAFSGVGGSVVVPPATVPEPASWAMMVCGFGLIGSAMRRRGATAIRFA